MRIVPGPSHLLDHPRTVPEHRTFSVQNGSQIMVGHTEGTIIIVKWLYFYYYLVLTTTVPAFPPGTTTIVSYLFLFQPRRGCHLVYIARNMVFYALYHPVCSSQLALGIGS